MANLRDFSIALSSGQPASDALAAFRRPAQTSQPAQQTQDSSAMFGLALMDMLKKYQSLGTRPYLEQEIAARQAQNQRTRETPSELIGAAPSVQAAARNASESALNPTIQGAQQSQQTFGEQLRSFNDIIGRAETIRQNYETNQQKLKADMQENIKFALDYGGSEGLKAFLKEQPDAIKLAGFDAKTIEGLIPALEAKERAAKDKEAQEREYRRAQIEALNRKDVPTTAAGSDYTNQRVGRILQSVAELKSRVSNWTVAYGSFLSNLPATEARNFSADLETLRANIAFSELQEMRNASKTGGALGQVAVRELELLESTLGSLDPKQGVENVKKNLDKIAESLLRWNEAVSTLSGGSTDTGSADEWEYIPD